MNLTESLQKVPALSEVPIPQLGWLVENSTCHEYNKGDYLFSRGDPIDNLQIIISGKFSVRVEQNGEFKNIAEIHAGDISGLLPYSRAVSAIGYGIAHEHSQVIILHKDHFREMIRNHHDLTTALVHTMTSRVREFTKNQQLQEKMMSLGKLSAGLAHELNNPSSAMARSAKELKKHLGALPDKFKNVISIRMEEVQVDAVNEILFNKIDRSDNKPLSLTQKTELEDEIANWLEDHGFEDGYELADTFVEFGFATDDFDSMLDHVTEKDLVPVVEWMQNVLITETLINEIDTSATRISDLVSSIKSYTHMDKGTEMEKVNIMPGIENTLMMLNHKLKQKQIEIDINVPETVPAINARVGSLNQVWTNIIDNAVDAMDQGGRLSISIEQDDDCLVVFFEDNGKGVPAEIQSRIFDPFFTTKKIGEGTGMGLDIVSKIIRNHHADISLSSNPGQTRFTIKFPIANNSR